MNLSRHPAALLTLILSIAVWIPHPADAHGTGHEVITALTAQLAERPNDTALLVERGEQYLSHADLPSARADLEKALRIDPKLDAARVRLAIVTRDEGKPDEALRMVSGVLERQSTNHLARSIRADLYASAGRPAEAVADYNTLLVTQVTPRPDLFLARARAEMAVSSNRWSAAVRGLDQGIVRLGPVPSLHLMALDLEEQGRDYKAALRRVDTIIEMAPRTDRWLMRRGDILTAAGRMDDARKSYRDALAALDDLPESQRRTIASTELRRDIEARLAGKSSAVEPSRP